HDLGGWDDGNVKGQAWIALAEVGDQPRQEGEADAFGRGNAHRSGADAPQEFDFGYGRFHGRGQTARMAEQNLAGRRQAQAPLLPQEEGYAKSILKLGNLTRYSRRSHVEAPGRLADGKMGGNGIEIDQRGLVKDARQQICRQRMFAR